MRSTRFETPNPVIADGHQAQNRRLVDALDMACLRDDDAVDLRGNEVAVEVLYCGVGPANVHQARAAAHEATATLMLGQEIIGRITALGRSVSRFKRGDIVGVGAMAAACGHCDHCAANLEQYCQDGPVSTLDYQRLRRTSRAGADRPTSIIVTEPLLVRIPAGTDLASLAPLLGAGIATYSAIKHWKLEPGQHIGVIGMGGLGHMAVKIAASMRARVTVFTTSPEKLADATRFGARKAVLWNDEAAFDRLANQFDLLISTVPHAYSVENFMALLKLNGTLINLGTTEDLEDVSGSSTSRSRRSVAGSTGGSVAEIHEMMDHCSAHQITPEIKLISPDQIHHVLESDQGGTVPYRYVVDFASAQQH